VPVVLAGVALIALLALFVAYGFSQLARGQAGGFLGWLEGVAITASGVGLFVTKQILRLTSWLTHELGKHYQQIEHVGVQWVAGLSQYLKLMAQATVPWAFTLSQALYWLVRSEIPRLLRALPTRVERVVKSVGKEVTVIRKTVYKFPKLSKAQVQAALAAVLPASLLGDFALLRWIRNHFTAIRHAAAHAGEIALPLPRIITRDLPVPWGRTITQIRKRLHRLEGLFGVTVLATAMAGVLGLPNWRCLTRGNIGKTARALCGLPANILNDFLGLLIDFLVINDICQIITLLDNAFSVIEQPLADFVGVVNGALCHGDYPGAPALSRVTLSLPPVTGY
jgi:hypothetical protein